MVLKQHLAFLRKANPTENRKANPKVPLLPPLQLLLSPSSKFNVIGNYAQLPCSLGASWPNSALRANPSLWPPWSYQSLSAFNSTEHSLK